MFKDNKYTKYYTLITDAAKTRNNEGYIEHHHIIPQSLGGSNDKKNLVGLTAREHFICHWLLIKMTEGEARSKMLYALHGMRAENRYQQRYSSSITARVYERYRIEHAKNHSETMKGRTPPNKGRAMSDEQKVLLRERAKANHASGKMYSAESQQKRIAKVTGQKRSDETKIKMSLASRGKPKGPMSEEEKLKRSITQKGKAKPEGFGDKVAERMKQSFTENNPNKREDLKKICPHCGTKSGPSGYARWHGDNCKQQ